MTNNAFSVDDPENNDKSSNENQAEEKMPAQNAFSFTAAFDAEIDELDKMRQALIEREINRPEIDLPEAPLQLGNQQNQNMDSSPFSSFDDDDFDLAISSDPTLAVIPNPNSDLFTIEPSYTPNFWSDDLASETGDITLSQRIDSLQSDDRKVPSARLISTPPFVMDDAINLKDDNSNSLTDKIRKGLVPAETLELLITKTMTEAEVVSFAKKLGIDWNLTPGETREDKIEFLVYYFNNRITAQQNKSIFEKEQLEFLSPKTEDDWRESDSRLHALQQILNLPETPIDPPKLSFLEKLKAEFQQASPLEKNLTIGLSAFAVLLLLGISLFLFAPKKPTPVVIPPTPISDQKPYPLGVEFPGGWSFDLSIGSVQGGIWNPKDPEWLQGTEICRLVSIPWNKQLDAVFKTFSAEDRILLTMSNKDVLTYKVESASFLKSSELNQLLNRDSPCLVVVYAQQETDSHQVIIAIPDYSIPTKKVISTEPANGTGATGNMTLTPIPPTP